MRATSPITGVYSGLPALGTNVYPGLPALGTKVYPGLAAPVARAYTFRCEGEMKEITQPFVTKMKRYQDADRMQFVKNVLQIWKVNGPLNLQHIQYVGF